MLILFYVKDFLNSPLKYAPMFVLIHNPHPYVLPGINVTSQFYAYPIFYEEEFSLKVCVKFCKRKNFSLLCQTSLPSINKRRK